MLLCRAMHSAASFFSAWQLSPQRRKQGRMPGGYRIRGRGRCGETTKKFNSKNCPQAWDIPSLRARTESISPTLGTLHPLQAPCTNCTTARRPPWLLSKRICRPSVRGMNAPMGMSRPAVTSRKPGKRRLMRIH